MIKIKEQQFISEKGKRENNEDCCGLINGSTYVVCDGVGGAEKGEVASKAVVEALLNAYKKHPPPPLERVIGEAEQSLSGYLTNHPQALGMATTLTLSRVTPEGLSVAWVGDSRIYQFRGGRIVFVTKDHSWVNEALQSGILTPEEAKDHPKSNIITRAIQGLHKPVKAEATLLTDVQKGDYILHCSDGVLEAWNDEDLSALFSGATSCQQLIERIKQECLKDSKDNFTAIVYRIEEGQSPGRQDLGSGISGAPSLDKKVKKKASWKILFLISLIIICLLSVKLVDLLNQKAGVDKETIKPEKEKPPIKEPGNTPAESPSSSTNKPESTKPPPTNNGVENTNKPTPPKNAPNPADRVSIPR
jgi:serine/threonine protein phosphatase PrpC